jgi:hypothetical protein
MNTDLLAVLSRERRRAVREDFARGDLLAVALRSMTARSLRASGEGLFRLGVALDERVCSSPVSETDPR